MNFAHRVHTFVPSLSVMQFGHTLRKHISHLTMSSSLTSAPHMGHLAILFTLLLSIFFQNLFVTFSGELEGLVNLYCHLFSRIDLLRVSAVALRSFHQFIWPVSYTHLTLPTTERV